MLNNPEEARLGGQERVLTVLFSDLASFTSYSETLLAEPRSSAILGEYFERMTEIFSPITAR